MQIHIVVKTWKDYDDWLTQNVVPFLSKAKADLRVAELNKALTEEEELTKMVQFYVESFDIAA